MDRFYANTTTSFSMRLSCREGNPEDQAPKIAQDVVPSQT